MFAVIKTGGKQYKVAAEDRITVMTLPGQAGDAVTFDEVLSLGDGAALEIGSPVVGRGGGGGGGGAPGPKVIAFKKRRRQNSRRKRGHRQDLTLVKITGIVGAGQLRPAAETDAAGPA